MRAPNAANSLRYRTIVSAGMEIAEKYGDDEMVERLRRKNFELHIDSAPSWEIPHILDYCRTLEEFDLAIIELEHPISRKHLDHVKIGEAYSREGHKEKAEEYFRKVMLEREQRGDFQGAHELAEKAGDTEMAKTYGGLAELRQK